MIRAPVPIQITIAFFTVASQHSIRIGYCQFRHVRLKVKDSDCATGYRQAGYRPPIAEFLNAFVAFLFAATAPVAIILSVSLNSGLSEIDIASWIFAVLCDQWCSQHCDVGQLSAADGISVTIPGAVLVGQALDTVRFTEVIAYILTGLLLLLLGLTGWIKKVMDWLPQPIVMGMVAGAFVNFALIDPSFYR